MSSSTDRNKLGQTRRESAESKAETTKRVSQEIQHAETEQRHAKTEKLRLARLAMQAEQSNLKAAGSETNAGRKRSRAKT